MRPVAIVARREIVGDFADYLLAGPEEAGGAILCVTLHALPQASAERVIAVADAPADRILGCDQATKAVICEAPCPIRAAACDHRTIVVVRVVGATLL